MKKKTRNIIFISMGTLALLFFYGRYNFNQDKQTAGKIIASAGNGDVVAVLDKIKGHQSFTNPIINFMYQRWRKKIYSRFITKDEVIENTSNNTIINDISNIYRDYWRVQLLKEDPQDRTDTTLYIHLADYLIENQLTELSRDSLEKNIKNDSELKKIIEAEGFKCDFKYRNGFQEVFIWEDETKMNYVVELPMDTIETTVIFIEAYHLNGYDDYASFGKAVVGGWALKESPTLYCNKGIYHLDSEEFRVSYLKHESLHFVDLNEYPNLSSADLEYRSKMIELMYASEETIYNLISSFISSASNNDRSHSHPYANHSLISNLSKIIFDSEFESDFNQWKAISVETINQAATEIYENSEQILQMNKNIKKII